MKTFDVAIAGAGLSLSGLSFGKDTMAADSEFSTGAKTNNQTVIGMKFEPRDVIRIKRRCKLCGRPRAVFRKFGICRICFRDMASDGLVHAESVFPPSLTLITAVILLVIGVFAIMSMVFQTGPFG